jgi:predicted enzyme related to lactoylglutathione lyase
MTTTAGYSFYKEVFRWEFNKWDGPQDYWLVKTGEDGQPGINGGLTPKMNQQSSRVTNTIDVPSIDDFSRRFQRKEAKLYSLKWQFRRWIFGDMSRY